MQIRKCRQKRIYVQVILVQRRLKMDCVADAVSRLKRELWHDPATGVMRHADAGYEDAKACACENGLSLPGMLGTEIPFIPKRRQAL